MTSSSPRTMLIAALLLCATLASCAAATNDADAGDDSAVTLTIRNRTSATIVTLQLTPAGDPGWGADRLVNRALAPGDELALQDIPCEVYAVRIVDRSPKECILDDIYLCADGSTWDVTSAKLTTACGAPDGGDVGEDVATGRLTVRNGSTKTFTELRLSLVDDLSWGPDRLGQAVLAPGNEVSISGIACGNYDVQIEADYAFECTLNPVHLCGDGRTWEVTDADVAGAACTSLAVASLTVQNASSAALVEVNVSPTSDSSWGPNRLGTDVLAPSNQVTFDVFECDSYDIRVIDAYGVDCDLRAIQLCSTDTVWTVTDATLLECDPANPTFTIRNKSSSTIAELNVSPTSDDPWGLNLARTAGLAPDGELTVVDVECDTYDVRIVDEYGFACRMDAMLLCSSDALLDVTEAILNQCAGL